MEPDYEEFDRDDPTARARVGPSPQLAANGDANYTVIYNFASPTPKRRRDGYAAGKLRMIYQFCVALSDSIKVELQSLLGQFLIPMALDWCHSR